MATEERKFVGLMTDLILIHESEEDQDQAMMDLAIEWSKKGYTICSGNVLEGKVNEIWAIKKEEEYVNQERPGAPERTR